MVLNKKIFLSWFIIFLLFFSYLTTAGFVFQKFILEFFSQNNVHLLLSPESTIANEIAISLSEKLKVDFWKNIFLIPYDGYSSNVSILAFFYFILGVNPYTNIIINSLFYSLSVLLLLFTFLHISNNSTFSKKSAFICSIIFLVWPSSLFLLSQIGDDFIIIFSYLLLIFFFFSLYRTDKLKSGLLYLSLAMFALVLMHSVRDNFFQIQFIIFFIMLVILLKRFLFIKFSFKQNHFYLFLFIIVISFYTSLNIFDKKFSKTDDDLFFNHLKIHKLQNISDEFYPDRNIIWVNSRSIPNFIENRIQAIASIKLINNARAIKYQAKTPINNDLIFTSSFDFIKSIPIILYQGLIEPHPLRFDIKQPKYLTVSLEMIFIYLCLTLFFYIKNKRFDMLYIFFIASCFLYIIPITFTVSTYGSLFRLRDPFLLILALIILRIFIDEYSKRNIK